MSLSYHLFETAIGWIGVAWSERGIARLLLPQRDRDAMERKLAATGALPSPPPAEILAVIDKVKRYAAGEAMEFGDVAVDLAGADDFQLAIYEAARKLSFGVTTTYGGLATAAGHAGLAREAGAALGRNPVPIIVPCHRILAAGNKIGGFSAPGGSTTKEKLLAMEGVAVGPPPKAQASFAF
ncbi:methylated-DNA--[protein]-cysteine S-methyltransferase [Arvimicrobium flavum]|uniref:methylated-DNA--[protein]-cysteine S-methyltransferase n=1 Tax=Arvimicrobium flavum TaxID=3393320 RepID=UPI00237A823E|nr:methylated-DNA--[protein]-cysteine S-methyltransferase [Mesorhizobium shangrilense]